jgi:hypothetical protein
MPISRICAAGTPYNKNGEVAQSGGYSRTGGVPAVVADRDRDAYPDVGWVTGSVLPSSGGPVAMGQRTAGSVALCWLCRREPVMFAFILASVWPGVAEAGAGRVCCAGLPGWL